MKKNIFYSTLILLSFFISCSESAQRTEQKTENSGTTVKEPVPNNITDTSKNTNVSIGPNGVNVNNKNTQIQVDRNGIKIGTKKVNVDVKK
jgi:hypothetical protein